MRRTSPGLTAHARWLVIALALAVSTPRAAWAHAHLVRSAPAANAHLNASPALIKLWFSEAAEATMTTVTVTGPNGTRASIGTVTVDPNDPLLLIAPVDAPLAAGRYTINWRTVARDDGHPSSGSFVFVVDSQTTAMTGSISGGDTTAPTSSTVRDSASIATPAAVSQQGMDVEAPSYVLARWLNFAALITVIGAAAFALLVLPRVTAHGDPEQFADFDNNAARRAATLGFVAGLVFLFAAVWRLYAEHAVIGGNVAMGTLLQSFWGHVWIAQAAIAVIACIAFALARSARRGSVAWIAAAAAAVVLAATPAFSGHAIAAPGNRAVSVALDAIHVIAAGGWLGGLLVLAIVGVPAALSVGGDRGASGGLSLVARLVNAFSPLALTFAGFVVVSGVIAAWMRLGSVGALFHSTYGTVLLIKLVLVLLVLAGGAFNWLRMRRALAHGDTEQTAIGSFRRSAWLELTAGVLVIAATAVLVATQPPVR